MNSNFEVRYAASPREVKKMDTQELRDEFLVQNIFENDTLNFVYSHYDRYIVAGVVPVKENVALETIDPLKADYFLQRRELGVINIGGTGSVLVDGITYVLDHKEALNIGQGNKEVVFSSNSADNPAKFYINSTPAHKSYPTKKIGLNDVKVVELGAPETVNARTLRKCIVNSVVDVCQLQMGITTIKSGSCWNTMPAHVHDRRMEVYFYIEVPEGQSVCHFMGQTDETRHIWMQNEEAVISPRWSIHSGSGTSNYTIIWGMSGENLDYSDMDVANITNIR